jgi:hypothetical protein
LFWQRLGWARTVGGRVGAGAVGAAENGRRAAGGDRLFVAFLRAGGVGASVGRSGVVVGTEWADVALRLAGRSRMSVLPAFLALHEAVGGVGSFHVSDP